MWTTINSFFLSLLIFSAMGCSATHGAVEESLSVSPVNALADIVRVLYDYPKTVDREEGRVATAWGPVHEVGGEPTLFLGNRSEQRVRYRVTVRPDNEGSRILVKAQIERRPISGPRIFRWVRVLSDGALEKALLDRIREEMR